MHLYDNSISPSIISHVLKQMYKQKRDKILLYQIIFIMCCISNDKSSINLRVQLELEISFENWNVQLFWDKFFYKWVNYFVT